LSYKFQPGTLPHRAAQYLLRLQPGETVSTAAMAEALEVDGTILTTTLMTAVKHGAIAKDKIDGHLRWRMGDGTPLPLPDDYEPDQPLPPRRS